MAGRQQVRAGDLTGRQKAQLAAEHAAEQEARAGQIALATAAAAEAEAEPVDLEPNKPEVKEEVVGEVAVAQDVDVLEEIVEFRVNDTFDATIGHGNDYSFQEGRVYRAPRHIRDHLEEKGLIWH
jgi:hypothetical protein